MIWILSTLLLAVISVHAADLSDLGVSPQLLNPIFYNDPEDALAVHQGYARQRNGTELCKTFPGDDEWPSDTEWAAFNETVDGALLRVAPRAAVCHSSWPEYDAEKCAELIANWGDNDQRTAHPTELIYPYFQGWTCLPSIDPSTPCTLGGDPEYVVNVTKPEQISAAINFAKERNIRLIIKNTGHDVSGKSTGAGSLSIWTYNLKNIEWLPGFESGDYIGPAFKIGAGVSLEEFYRAADEHDVTLVGGECSTVGAAGGYSAGGYSAGGGHSPMGGLFGMAADNIVELTAVLPNGTHMNVTSSTAPDLLWAFRGGGGSTFGVVTSITVKAHPKIYATVSQWQFSTVNTSITNATFWDAIKALFEHSPKIADSGSQMYAGIAPAAGRGLRLSLFSFVAPNKTIAEYDNLMRPWFLKLQGLGIDIVQNTTFHPSYLSAWQRAFPKIPNSPFSLSSMQVGIGSRLLPRANFEDAALFERTLDTMKNLVARGYNLRFYVQKNTAPAGIDNAVNPAYRQSVAFVFFSGSYTLNATREQINAARTTVTKVLLPMFKKITPGGGTYMNEADCREDDWQQSFFGSHYARLLQIKNELDPDRVFWARTAVGSEDWYVQDDGGFPEIEVARLCRRA